jgi:hypothetical protein
LPWRKGLVSRKVSKRLSESLTNRIKDGSFTPNPDNELAVSTLRKKGMREVPPYRRAINAERTKELSKKNVRYSRKDFENVLAVMRKRKITLREACMDRDLPGSTTVKHYANVNPDFRKKMLDTYYSLPYAVQARADMFSPQFYQDLMRLKAKGLPGTEIAEKFGISEKTIYRRLKRIKSDV